MRYENQKTIKVKNRLIIRKGFPTHWDHSDIIRDNKLKESLIKLRNDKPGFKYKTYGRTHEYNRKL